MNHKTQRLPLFSAVNGNGSDNEADLAFLSGKEETALLEGLPLVDV